MNYTVSVFINCTIVSALLGMDLGGYKKVLVIQNLLNLNLTYTGCIYI